MMRKFDDFNDRHGKNNPHVHNENYYFDKTSADESLVKDITFVVPDENYKIYDTIIGESLADLYSIADEDTIEMSEEDTLYSDGRKGTFVTISFKLKPDVRISDYEYALDYFFEGIEEAFSAFDISYDNFFPEKEDKEVENSDHSTDEQGICPVCHSDNIEYHGGEIDDAGYTYNCECNDCHSTWDECYDLEFAGNYNVVDNTSEVSSKKQVKNSAQETRIYLINMNKLPEEYEFDFVDLCFEIAQSHYTNREISLETALKTIANIAEEQGTVWTTTGFMIDFNSQEMDDLRPADCQIYIGDAIK